MRTGNPVLNNKAFDGIALYPDQDRMTIYGTVNKTAILLVIALIPAIWTWRQVVVSQNPSEMLPLAAVGAIGGLVFALITSFVKKAAPYTAPVYAAFEGLLIGAISAFYELRFHGIVIQAVGLTFGTLLCLLLAYRTGIIRATENFKLGVFAATGSIALLYLVNFVLTLFGHPIGFIHEGGTFGILFSLFVVGIAALNLVLDFDFIESSAQRGSPKYMEWYAAFGLLVTLIWLYLEILRLLGKSRRR